MMRIKSLLFISSTLILLLLFQNVYGVESEYYCEQLDGSKFYYDKDNVVYSSGKVKIWNSVVLSDIGKKYVKNNFDTSGIDTNKIITYNEIYCTEQRFRVLSVIFSGETKSALRMIDNGNRMIVPNTCPEELFNIICKSRK
jgi:hypothetical protein